METVLYEHYIFFLINNSLYFKNGELVRLRETGKHFYALVNQSTVINHR